MNKSQTLALQSAVNNGEGWTSTDLDFVAEFRSEPVLEVALALGRTVYSISAIRELLDAGIRPGSNRSVRKQTVYPVCSDCFQMKTPANTCGC